MENFEACWHSYHLECLTDFNVCPICRVGVENAIRFFSLHANRSVNPSRNTASDHDENIIDGEQGLGSGDRNDHCTADDDDDLPTSTINANIEQIFQNLTLHVMSVSERPPPVQVVSRSSINQDYPFNSQGASRKSCPLCSLNPCASELCSVSCTCLRCARRQAANANTSFLTSFPQCPSIVQERQVNNDVAEWVISMSQSAGQLGFAFTTGALANKPYWCFQAPSDLWKSELQSA